MLHVWCSGVTPEADNRNFSRLSGRIRKDPSSAGKPREAAIGRFDYHVAKNLTHKTSPHMGRLSNIHACLFESPGAKLFLVPIFSYDLVSQSLGPKWASILHVSLSLL